MTARAIAVLAAAAGSGFLLSAGGAPPGLQERPDRFVPGEPLSVGADRVAAGPTVELRDSVPGDAMVAGGQVRTAGPVAGDVLGAGGRVVVAGPVEGSVRAAGGQVEIAAPVSGNVTLAGGLVQLGDGAEVGGNAYLAGGTVEVSAPIRGHLMVGGEEVLIDGPVDGSVEVAAERLALGDDARIRGDLSYRSPEAVDRAPGAEVAGTVTRRAPEGSPAPEWLPDVAGWVGTLFGLAAFLFTGLALGAVFPGSAERLLASGRAKPLPSLGIGVLALLAVPALLLAALITVVGIPLALAGGALFLFSVYVARAVLAMWIGDALLGERAGEGRRRVLLAFLVGGGLLFLVGLVPWVGTLVEVLATAFGLGAAAVALRGGRRGTASAAEPGTAETA